MQDPPAIERYRYVGIVEAIWLLSIQKKTILGITDIIGEGELQFQMGWAVGLRPLVRLWDLAYRWRALRGGLSKRS